MIKITIIKFISNLIIINEKDRTTMHSPKYSYAMHKISPKVFNIL